MSFVPTSLPPGASEPKRTTKETHPNLPPGLILDAEGKVCKVCNSWQDWAKVGKKKDTASGAGGGSIGDMFKSARKSTPSSSSSATSLSTTATAAVAAVAGAATADRTDCPPDTAALGRSTWTFLHTTAAYYPLRASPAHQSNMRSLLSSLPILYPCGWCAEDFGRDMAANPPDLSGREGLSRWLCQRHNEVNNKLGKEVFECTTERLDERWKDGPKDGRCD